jgi:hypothetical protein
MGGMPLVLVGSGNPPPVDAGPPEFLDQTRSRPAGRRLSRPHAQPRRQPPGLAAPVIA